jgi:hypothetical protein
VANCGGCGRACGAGERCAAGRCLGEAPQLVRPLSGLPVTIGALRFGWRVGDGIDAVLELCADRSCTQPIWSREVQGTIYEPPERLSPGTYFWRVWPRRGTQRGSRPSVTWRFSVVDGPVSYSVDNPSLLFTLERWSRPARPGTSCVDGSTGVRIGWSPPRFETIGDEDGDGYLDALCYEHYSHSSCGSLNLRLGVVITQFRGSAVGLMQVGMSSQHEWQANINQRFDDVDVIDDFNGDGFADTIRGTEAALHFEDVHWGTGGRLNWIDCSGPATRAARVFGDIDGDLAAEVQCAGAGAAMLARTVGSQLVPVVIPRCESIGAEPILSAQDVQGLAPLDANGDRFIDVVARARLADGSERAVVWLGGIGGLRGDRCAAR